MKHMLWYNLKDMWGNFTSKDKDDEPPIFDPVFKELSIDPLVDAPPESPDNAPSGEDLTPKEQLFEELEANGIQWYSTEVNGYW